MNGPLGNPDRLAPIPLALDEASNRIIGAAIEVHRILGPGLLEGVYETALVHELRLRRMEVRRQWPVPVTYKDLRIDGHRLDLLVDPGVVVELKAVERILTIHEAQLLSYLKSTGLRLGLLINFHAEVLKNGVRRLVN
jgi:GxxExxY protein